MNCRLSDAEYRHLLAFAKRYSQQQQVRPATLLRKAAFAALTNELVPLTDLTRTAEQAIQELRRIGTNLNQIAAKANSLQRVTHGDLRSARQAVSELEDTAEAFRSALAQLPSGACS